MTTSALPEQLRAARPRIARHVDEVRRRGRQRLPLVTSFLMAAVLSVAVNQGVVHHDLSLLTTYRYGFQGRSLLDGDWSRLLTSQLLTRDTFMLASILLSLFVMLGVYEVLAGTPRSALVAVVSGIAGPVLVTGALGLGSALGVGFVGRTLSTVDYGASAITAGAGGALVATLGWPRLRQGAVLFLVAGLVLHHQFADWEHLAAFAPAAGVLGGRLGVSQLTRERAQGAAASSHRRRAWWAALLTGVTGSAAAAAIIVTPPSGAAPAATRITGGLRQDPTKI